MGATTPADHLYDQRPHISLSCNQAERWGIMISEYNALVQADAYATAVYMAVNHIGIIGFELLVPMEGSCDCSSSHDNCNCYNPWVGVLSGGAAKTSTGPSPLV